MTATTTTSLSIIWILISSFQYGYHISALNQLQKVLSLSDLSFSVVTSIFTIGGLIGSISANYLIDSSGRFTTTRLSAILLATGAGVITLSQGVFSIAFGRLLVGIASGLGLCVGPVFLSEISPPKIKANVGVLTQLAIVLGITTTQSLGFFLATPASWRLVLLFSCLLSVLQLLLSPFISDSPPSLYARGFREEANTAARRLWGSHFIVEPLLPPEDVSHSVSVAQLFKSPDLRSPLLIVSFAMLSQQLSGINAVLYYSNDILRKSLPEFGPYLSLAITLVNVLMTFPTVFLIERTGRKKLFQLSASGAILSLVALGVGLDYAYVTLGSVAILTFVMSFAIGLGPVPFVMIPEVSPFHAVSAISSVALSVNWVANFVVGLGFLPLRNLLAGGDPMKEGRVFYVFAGVLCLSVVVLGRVYRTTT